MKLIKSVAPDLSVCLTNDNRVAVMVDNEYGEQLAEVTDVEALVRTLREFATLRPASMPEGMTPTAEAELNRRYSGQNQEGSN